MEILTADQVRQRAENCMGKSKEDVDLHMFTGWKVIIRKEGSTYTNGILRGQEKQNIVYLYMNPSGEKFIGFDLVDQDRQKA